MLNYAPDSMARSSAMLAYAWAHALPTECLPVDLLYAQIDASQQASMAFHPEQVSGFCASG